VSKGGEGSRDANLSSFGSMDGGRSPCVRTGALGGGRILNLLMKLDEVNQHLLSPLRGEACRKGGKTRASSVLAA